MIIAQCSVRLDMNTALVKSVSCSPWDTAVVQSDILANSFKTPWTESCQVALVWETASMFTEPAAVGSTLGSPCARSQTVWLSLP